MPDVSEATARSFQVIAGVSSLVIALTALIISIRNDRRAERVAAASVRPILVLERLGYIDHKAVRLLNHGTGVAVVDRIEIQRDGEDFHRLVDVFTLDVVWDRYFWILPGQNYLPPTAEKLLVKLTHSGLVSQGKLASEAADLLDEWEKQLAGTKVRIKYTDVFGNEMPACEREF